MDRDEKEALLRQRYEAGEVDTGSGTWSRATAFDIKDTMSFQCRPVHTACWADGGGDQPDESTCHDQSQYDLSAVDPSDAPEKQNELMSERVFRDWVRVNESGWCKMRRRHEFCSVVRSARTRPALSPSCLRWRSKRTGNGRA